MTPRNVLRVAALTVVVGVGTCLTGGTAYAFWSAAGTGSGAAAAGTMQPLTTSPATAASGLLYPGSTGDLRLTIANPNPFAVTVSSVVGNGPVTSDKGAACDASTGVAFTDQTGLALVVPPGSSQSFTLAGSVTMDNSSDDSCQGAAFTVPVALAGASS